MGNDNNDKEPKKTDEDWNGYGLTLGLCLGVAFGVIFDQIAIGIGVGLAIGLAFDSYNKKNKKE